MRNKKMYSSRYENMVKACAFVARNPKSGNTDIANAIGVSRQSVNKIMTDAVLRGWVTVEQVDWRPNAKAKRYSIGRFYPFVF